MRPEPAAATWLLERFSSSVEHESVTGDLLEQYHVGRGRFWYWWQVFGIVFLRLYRGTVRRPPVHKNSFSLRPAFALVLLIVTGYIAIFVFEARVPDALGVIFVLIVPLGTLGTVTVLYWHKRYPCVFQALNLYNRKAANPIRSILSLKSACPIVPHR